MSRDDEGFTLIELLITLVVMPVVMGGLVMMLFLVFQTQNNVTNKLAGSSDSSVTAALLTQDVESATAVTTESTPSCGSTGTQILGVKSSNTGDIASYDLVADGTAYELFREECTTLNTVTSFSQTLISSNVPSTLKAAVSCAATCATSSSWVYAATVYQIGLAVAETKTGVSYAITASPRLWNAASVGLNNQEDPFPIPPLDILASGSCSSASLTLSGNADVVVSGGAGSADDNSTCADSISFQGNAVVTAANIETGDTTPSASYTKSSNASIPSVVYAAPTGDPFTGLTAPTNPTASGSGSCTSSGGSGSCTPGSYANSVSFSGGTWTVDAGTYVFTQPVSISGGTVVFGSGTYLFEGGLALSGNSTVTFDTGTYLFEGTSSTANALSVAGNANVASGPGGTLFYVETGAINFAGNGNISLSGPSSYDGISIWQAKTDTNNATLAGNSAVSDAYGGIYTPGAEIVPAGNSILSAAFVVANAISFGGNSALSVG